MNALQSFKGGWQSFRKMLRGNSVELVQVWKSRMDEEETA